MDLPKSEKDIITPLTIKFSKAPVWAYIDIAHEYLIEEITDDNIYLIDKENGGKTGINKIDFSYCAWEIID